jgi:hypothetical protein
MFAIVGLNSQAVFFDYVMDKPYSDHFKTINIILNITTNTILEK